MALPTIPGIMRVAQRLAAVGIQDEVINVFHVAGTNPGDEVDVGNALQVAWNDTLFDYVSNLYTMIDLTCTRLDGSASVVVPATQGTGGATDDPLPMNVAASVGWRTNTGGRSHRGRSYLGPLTVQWTNLVTPDKFDETVRAACESSGLDFIAEMVAADFPLVVASYLHSSSTAVVDCKVNPQVATVRRRVNGH